MVLLTQTRIRPKSLDTCVLFFTVGFREERFFFCGLSPGTYLVTLRRPPSVVDFFWNNLVGLLVTNIRCILLMLYTLYHNISDSFPKCIPANACSVYMPCGQSTCLKHLLQCSPYIHTQQVFYSQEEKCCL